MVLSVELRVDITEEFPEENTGLVRSTNREELEEERGVVKSTTSRLLLGLKR